MKTGIITFHRANNFGAILQACALQQYISENICPCELIDFIPNNAAIPAPSGMRNALMLSKHTVGNFLRLFIKDRTAKFNLFRKENCVISKETYRGDQALIQNPPLYDVVISGSDQIFNLTLSGNSKSFYLQPWQGVKKISYASSFGRETLSPEEYQLIQEELPKFNALSVREFSGAQIIFEGTGITARIVVDPVFLLNQEQWAAKGVPLKAPKNYVLAYAMEYSESMQELILKKMAKGLSVYLLCGSQTAEKLPGKKIRNCGPAEFLTYIKNASLILTNSFHGTAFSMIYGKPFFCVAHSTRNTRLKNILELTKNQENLLGTHGLDMLYDEKCIDGKQAYASLSDIIATSKEYLQTSISS